MSSPVSAPILRLERRPSPSLMIVLVVVHGAALLVLWPLPLSIWIKALLAMAILVQAMITWRHHVNMRAPTAVKRLVWGNDDQWELFPSGGGSCSAQLLPASYVHPLLVILRFMTEDKRRCAVIVPPDGLGPDDHRRLRVRLRLTGGKEG